MCRVHCELVALVVAECRAHRCVWMEIQHVLRACKRAARADQGAEQGDEAQSRPQLHSQHAKRNGRHSNHEYCDISYEIHLI